MLKTTQTRTRGNAAAAPTVDDVREGLQASLPPADYDRVWHEVCAQMSIPTTVSSLSPEELSGLLDRIAAQDRLCQVLAMSWRIRCTAARKLTELGR